MQKNTINLPQRVNLWKVIITIYEPLVLIEEEGKEGSNNRYNSKEIKRTKK
jgi:hypothetical protein